MAMSTAFGDTDDVFQYMQENIVETMFRGERQKFLRKSAFDEVTTKEVIYLVALKDETLFLSEEKLDQFAEQVAKCGTKLFLTCLQGDLPMSCLQLLLESKITDASMPLTKDDYPGKVPKRAFVGSFVPNQVLFNTAYLPLDSFQDLTGLTKPIEYDKKKLIGKGAFGSVYKIQIHPDHRSFMSGNNKDEFAMKVTELKGTRELPYHKAMSGLSHPHLVKCLASFQFASQYHMIYEKADSNLEEFMEKNKDPSALHSLKAQELAQQLAGIIGAVFTIHNQLPPDEGASRLGVPQTTQGQRSGYLHDIKPDNLLVFRNYQGVRFRLSDFSCARVVDFVASVSGLHRQSWQSTGKSGTPIYRAPESTTEGKTSRPYDIWSLGCVLIEVLVWYTEGFEALEVFRKSRLRTVKPSGIEDEGFYYIDPNGQGHLREQVADRLKTVPSRCEGPLRIIADAVSQMLEIDPKKRPTAEQLVSCLKVIDQPSQPLTLSNPANTLGVSHTRASLPASPTYVSESDSDFGPVIKIHVQNPTNE